MTRTDERTFKVWEYLVSHGQLLIRSPKAPATGSSPERTTNVDLVCVGVEYMALPRALHGLVVREPTAAEVASVSALLGKPVDGRELRMLESEGRRFPVVATSLSISENDWDIFDSPFEHHSRSRVTGV